VGLLYNIYDNVLYLIFEVAMLDDEQIKYYLHHPDARVGPLEFLLGLLVMVGGVLLLGLVVEVLSIHANGYPIYVWAGLAVTFVGASWGAHMLRDVEDWQSIAWMQIGLCAATGVGSLLFVGSWSGIAGFLGAMFTASNAFKRVREIWKGRSK
jgi:hypothetical protein